MLPEEEDQALAARYALGDEEAYARLWFEYEEKFYQVDGIQGDRFRGCFSGIALRFTSGKNDVAERSVGKLSQQLLTACRRRMYDADKAKWFNWAVVVLRRIVISELRKTMRFFQLSIETIERLCEAGIPQEVADSLQNMLAQPIMNSVEFNTALRNCLGREGFEVHGKSIRNLATVPNKSFDERIHSAVSDDFISNSDLQIDFGECVRPAIHQLAPDEQASFVCEFGRNALGKKSRSRST